VVIRGSNASRDVGSGAPDATRVRMAPFPVPLVVVGILVKVPTVIDVVCVLMLPKSAFGVVGNGALLAAIVNTAPLPVPLVVVAK
jgi:hypothetical protein